MPGLNHKGPNGEGPQTGRGLGNCGNKSQSLDQDQSLGNSNKFNGRREGRGIGKGRRVGNESGRGRSMQNGRHN
jgi:hypothetical protein